MFYPNVFNYSCNLQKKSALRKQFCSCGVKGSWSHFQGGTASVLASWISREVAPWHTKLKLWETWGMWALTFMVFAYLANFSKVLQMRLPFEFNALMLAWCSRKLWAKWFCFFFSTSPFPSHPTSPSRPFGWTGIDPQQILFLLCTT